eukprot:CAMPEP_0184859388 /NCGR_PEP_ID=MMETSP0580-20130426/4388_1 /TAXON_ID=1118495 /ORGANISM="Dactyliosolen fragilissimus" /LENGTH=218 /DNA_ID=CAMNT_0027355991 /DNA_START=258 /DNA_END=914 /DNA_ORIENTATION=-
MHMNDSIKSGVVRSVSRTDIMTKCEGENSTYVDDFGDEDGKDGDIFVTSSILLPFSSDVAYDAFSDLTRQPSWSSWLHSVEYINSSENQSTFDSKNNLLPESKWTMKWKKLRFSWIARSTCMERPRRISWESTSGLKNKGSVSFVETGINDDIKGQHTINAKDGANHTKMTLSMKFETPKLIAKMMKRSKRIALFVEKNILQATLVNFREIILLELKD